MSTPASVPSLGREFAFAEQLRTLIAKALAEAAGKPDKSQRLHTFLTASIALIGTRDTAAPTVSTRTHDATKNCILINCNEGLDPYQVPPASAFAIAPARTVVGVKVEGRTIHVEYSGVRLTAANSPTVAYTQPSLPAARVADAAGNLLATAAAAAVTVTP